jgi:hypothetical protein
MTATWIKNQANSHIVTLFTYYNYVNLKLEKKVLSENVDDQTMPTLVNVTFNLVAIQEFDEVNGKFSVIGFFEVSWYDSRMTWKHYLLIIIMST